MQSYLFAVNLEFWHLSPNFFKTPIALYRNKKSHTKKSNIRVLFLVKIAIFNLSTISNNPCDELFANANFSRTELLDLAREQKQEGKIDLAEFIVNRGAKVVAEVLETTWEMENSKRQLDRQTKTRIQLINEAKEGQCVEGCYGQWLTCAKEVLERNGIDAQYYGRSIQDLLEKGRGKYRNIMNIVVANCGKTFLLNSQNVIFNTFSNPACTSFAWVGAEKAECIFLNDFRWSPCIIPWHDLLLLEGQLVHLPAPKSHYAKDIVFDKDTPIFATGKNEIIFVKSGDIDDKETEMMAVR